jgi:hypothetical protein
MVGDTVFLVGAGALIWFLLGLVTGWSYHAREVSAALTASEAAPCRNTPERPRNRR